MPWAAYASFLGFAIVLVLIPGPDFTVVTRNTLTGGRRRGAYSGLGVASSNVVQGCAAVAGLGAVIVRLQPVFEVVKWAGIAYLLFLAAQAIRSAVRGTYPRPDAVPAPGQGVKGFRQGFLSNITNPKVLVFYLAVLPQFLGPGTPVAILFVFALTHALLSLGYLQIVVFAAARLRAALTRRAVRRGLDLATGAALVGFGTTLADQAL
jgi:threonine/homoserine/homoserine lactone efflux protein